MDRAAENVLLAIAAAAGVALLLRYRKSDGTAGELALEDLEEITITASRLPVPAEPSKGPPARNTPRGVRNNNPGNLDYLPPDKAWNGQVGSDGRFGIYKTAADGGRAMVKELQLSVKRGAQSVSDVIAGIPQPNGSRFDAWAPPHENDTLAYIKAVARELGVSPDARIDVTAHLVQLAFAIAQHENGRGWYTRADAEAWVRAA